MQATWCFGHLENTVFGTIMEAGEVVFVFDNRFGIMNSFGLWDSSGGPELAHQLRRGEHLLRIAGLTIRYFWQHSHQGGKHWLTYGNEEAGILVKHDFKAGKARYEINDDHNHLIDINSGEIVEFVDKDIEELQKKIAKKLGYNLVDHKLELYGSKIKK